MVSTSTQYLALLFNSNANTFTTYANLTKASLPTALQGGNFVLGEQCTLLLSGAAVYSIGSTNVILVKNFTSIQAYSTSLSYIISSNSLYVYSNSGYTDLQANLASYTNYKLKNYNNQLIAYGYNATSTSATYSIVQTIYIAVYSQSKYSLIQSLQINSTGSPFNYITLQISPLMTKLQYQYYSSSTLTIVFKQIDYTNSAVKDITFQSQTQFLTTTNKMQAFTQSNYFLGDSYLLVRNDTSLSTPNSGVYVE
jgi:hypothetical protein